MNFWHVEKMDDLVKVLKKLEMLSPVSFLIANVLGKDHDLFKEVWINKFLTGFISDEDVRPLDWFGFVRALVFHLGY